jgi:gamma-glutamyl:cysteine ligase YbdK (ATP-grasp superfamily)
MAEKANQNALVDNTITWLPSSHRFRDGRPLRTNTGGILAGEAQAIAHPDRVMDGRTYETSNGAVPIRTRRLGNLFLVQAGVHALHEATPRTGAEQEFLTTDTQTGEYQPIMDKHGTFHPDLKQLGLTPEPFNFMGEIGLPVTESAAETKWAMRQTLGKVARTIAEHGLNVAPLTIVGQRETSNEDANNHPYIRFVRQYLLDATGADTVEFFRAAGVQFHSEILDTMAAMEAAELYQSIAPILYAASVCGPFINGTTQATDMSVENPRVATRLQSLGMIPEDLTGTYQSWRYPIRRIGSSSGGSWHRPRPASLEDYLAQGNEGLKQQAIGTMDRFFGEHTDCRVRVGIKPHGTLEACNFDSFAGHDEKLAAFQALTTAILTNLQVMALYGVNPRQEFPELFGLAEGQTALHYANRHNFRVARNGMNAIVHNRPVHQQAEALLRLGRYTDIFPLTPDMEKQIIRSYSSDQQTRQELKAWCNREGKMPSIEAYYQTGVGSPAVYLQARAEALREQYPHISEMDIVRNVEHDMATHYTNRMQTIAA